VVTYAAADFFYIEEDSRCMGIRVEKTAHGLLVGMRADVVGTMKTNTNRERYILASSAAQTAPPNANGAAAPVGMNNSALGGGDWQVVGTGGQRGATGSLGLNNIGLLVRTWGQYEQVDATTFTLDDGAGLFVRCTVPPGTFLYSGWQYASVTGISSMYKFNASIYPPNILVRDIEVSLPVEVVSVPGTPSGNTSPAVNVSETYSTSGSTCSQGHQVEYSFNWGDGASSPWSTSTSASHSWSAPGAVTVTVTARCQAHPSVSATSAGLPVNVVVGPYPGEMIYIPAGSFLMGNSGVGNDAAYSSCSELPQHSVNLSAYYIGKYEVTRGEYRQFMNAGGYSNPAYWSSAGWSWKVGNGRTQPAYWDASQNWGSPPGTFTQTDNHPVVGVSYYESEAFCNWAGGHLPTEAQWEKAARWTGTHPNVYPWGDAWDQQKCNNWYDSLYPGYQTAPVGSYPSGVSPYGCQDMAGNVWEWVQDWYVSYAGSTCPFDYTNSSRVLRGGSWFDYDFDDRCAYRYGYNPSSAYCGYGNGFRIAR
jgi:formylglycine-generating enzyme required for sulfatase activity